MTTKRPAGKVYKKLAVKAGVYRQTSVDPYTGQMVTETVYVSPQYLRQSAWNTMQMMQRGLDVPVCLDHQESAVPKRRNDVDGWLANEMRSSVGLLKSVKYDPASESHEYIFEVRDPEIAKKIDLGIIKRVSPNFHNEFSPGDGTRWPNVVAHLALTFRPKDGKQSPDSMEAAAVTAPGQKRFSVLTPARNSKVVIVPMHKLEFSVLRSMVRKQKNGEWHFRSTDYLFRFNSHAEFESWLKRKYTKTLRMSVAGKTNYVLYFAVVHAPVGGVHINGRLYKGGQFIPTVNLDGLDQQTRQKIQESTSQRTAARSAKAAQYRNEGEDWHQAVARHAGEHSSRPISEDDERAAARRLKSLQAHHGDQVMERIASLAGQESAQLAKLSPDDPKAEHLKRRLRAYARMAEHMQGAGKAPAAEQWDAKNNSITMNGKEVAKYDFDRGSDSFWVTDMETGKGQKSFDTKQQMLDYVKKNQGKAAPAPAQATEQWDAKNNSVTMNGKEVAKYDFDRDSDSFWVSDMEGGKGQKSFDTKQQMLDYVKKNQGKAGQAPAAQAAPAQAVAKEDWREKIKGQPRWQAVDTLRQQDINDLTFDEYENVKKWDNEETGANDKEFEGRSPMRLNRGKDSFRVAHDRNMSEQYSEFLREQYDKAKEKAFLEGKNFIGGKPHWAMTLGEYERETGNSSEEYKQLMNRALSEGKIDERGNIVGSKPTQAPAQDDSGHRNALAEMADASGDVDTAVRSRLHNEMKTELADRMKDDWQHLTDEQKAEFEQKINALPHTALGDPDEHGEYSDKETSPEAQQIIDEVNDTAYEARRSNEAKAYEQKRIDQHKKDIEEADKRGMVFERPDNHNNPGELKVNPDKVHLAKQAMEEYRAKAKQHLIDSQNQLNKKEAARSKRMHRAMSDAADMIQDQVTELEKKAPAAPAAPAPTAAATGPDSPGSPVNPVNQSKGQTLRANKAWKPGQTIRSDDPNAVEALQAKHDVLKRENEIAKKANAIIRKYAQYDRFGTKEVKFDKGKTRDEVVADLVALGLSDRVANSVLTPPSWGELGFPAYHFANNNGQMAQIRKRMESVGKEQTRQAAQGDVETEYSGGVSVKEDTTDGRIKISFPGKPSREVIESLKRGGFRWSPTNGTWQRHLNNGGRYAVDNVLSKHGFTKQEAAPEASPEESFKDAYMKASSPAQPASNEAVGDSGAIVKNAYDNAVHSPKDQHEANVSQVKEALAGMDKAQLAGVAKQMELYGHENKSKGEIINDVVDKINNRRGTYQRAQMVIPLPKQDAENRASNDALSDNPVKKALGFDASSIDDIHAKLVESNPTDAYSPNHTRASASAMINNHISSFIREMDEKAKSGTITPDEAAAYDAIQQDKHFGNLREKLSDLGGAGWQSANDERIPAKIDPSHTAGPEDRYKNTIKDSRIESDSIAHDSHRVNYDHHKGRIADLQKQLDENGRARSRLSDLEYKAQRNGNKTLASKYAKQLEELDTKSSRLQDQKLEAIESANYSQSQMARTDPALPEFVKYAHFATKSKYTGEPNESMRKAIAPRAVQFAKQVGYDAEVGEEIAKELSKGLRVADKEGFDRIVRRSAGLVENQKKAERQRASVKAMEGYGDLSEMDKNTIENNISSGSIDSEIERIAKDKIEKNKAVAEGNRKYEQEQKQAGERKAQIEKMVADIAAGKAPENIKSSDMRAAVENAMKRKGDFRPSKGDTHRKFPKSHYTKDDMATRYNFQKLVKERGYWTDGKAIVAVPDDIRAASKGGEGAVPSIDPILQAADKAKSKARIVGEATPDDTNSFHKYLIEDQYGNQMQVAKDTHASVASLHPDAEIYIPEKSDGVGNLVYYKKDGKTVGVVVPLNCITRGDKEPKATVQDVKHIKEFAEPGPYKPEQMKVIGNMVAHPDMKAVVRIRSEGNKSAKHYKIDGYHGTYATENKAKEAAKELLSYIHGTDEGDETGDHVFKPKGQKTQADEGTRRKLDFHQSLNDHIASRQYKKSKVMQKGDIPEGKYSTKPGEYEVTEHDDESSPFKIVSSPYSRSGSRLKKEPTHSVVHKKSGAMLGSWTDIASAKKHAALAEGLHSWDFDKPDYFVDKKEEGDALKAKLKKTEDVIERDEYDPEVGIPARDKNKLSPGSAVTFSKDGSDLSGKVVGSDWRR